LASTDPTPPLTRSAKVLRAVHVAMGWLWANVLIGIFGLWLAGWVFRDRNQLTALCLAIPTVTVCLSLAATAVLAWAMRCRRVATAAAICAVFPTLSLLYSENQWHRPAPRGEVARSLRVVHWNVGEVGGGAQGILDVIKPLDADIYILAEFFGLPRRQGVTKGLGPEYRLMRDQFYVTVFARGTVKMVHKQERVSKRAYFARWDSPVGPLDIMLIDLKSRPLFYRGEVLDLVRQRMVEFQPDLVIGDFNAPRRARVLANLPPGYQHAYDAAGAGWSYTWPEEFPVWDIDQCILGPRIEPIRYDILPTGRGDHRLQILDFSIAQTQVE